MGRLYFIKLGLITDSKSKPTTRKMLSNNNKCTSFLNKKFRFKFSHHFYEITVVPGKTLFNKCKFLLHSRFLDFRFFPHIRDEISVLTSLRA